MFDLPFISLERIFLCILSPSHLLSCNFKPLLLYFVITGPSQPPFPWFPPTASMNESPENGLLYHTSSRDSCVYFSCEGTTLECRCWPPVSHEVSWSLVKKTVLIKWFLPHLTLWSIPDYSCCRTRSRISCLSACFPSSCPFPSHCFSIYNSSLLFPVAFDSAAVALRSLISLPPSHHSIFVSSRIVSPVVFSSFSWDSIPMFPLEKSANRVEWGRVIREWKRERILSLSQLVSVSICHLFESKKERKMQLIRE